jgi:hypothetical protein
MMLMGGTSIQKHADLPIKYVYTLTRNGVKVIVSWDKRDPSYTTRYVIVEFIVTLRQHVSTLSRGHHQAVEEVFIKS